MSLYRNDVLLDWAKKLHVERQFLTAEQRLLGGPSFGMARAVVADGDAVGFLWSPSGATPSAAVTGTPEPPRTVASAPPAVAEPKQTPPTSVVAPPVTPTTAREPASATIAPVDTPSKATSAHAPIVARRDDSIPHARAKAPAPAEATPTRSTKSERAVAMTVHLDEEPEPAPQRALPRAKADPATPKAAPGSLDAAIEAAAKKSHKSKKPAPRGSEYDPLNPNL